MVVEVFIVLCSALIGMVSPPPASKRTRQHLSSEIAALRETLENYYLHGSSMYNLVGGRQMDPVEFIRLALIKKEKINAEKVENNHFLRQSFHGNIDDIMLSKTKLEIEKLLEYKGRKKGKKVLVEGAPGIGKTMLALHLCRLWAEDKLLSEYNLVLLVPLRRFSAEDAKSLKVSSLLEMYSGEECADEIVRSGGEKVLIILEGWDELPAELRNEFTLFSDIINGLKLPKASVIITSRPTLANELYNLVDRRVEVLGFEQQQITNFVCQCFPAETSDKTGDGNGVGDSDRNGTSPAASKILEFLENNPHMKALAHIPLTLTIICCVFGKNDGALPETLTELYTECLCTTLLLNTAIIMVGYNEPDKLKQQMHLQQIYRSQAKICHNQLGTVAAFTQSTLIGTGRQTDIQSG